MTISLWLVILLSVAHWVGDFKFQSNWMAINKSKNNLALLTHVSVYMAALIVVLAPWVFLTHVDALLWTWFVLLNYALHFATDYVTSRMTTKRWFIALDEQKVEFARPSAVLLYKVTFDDEKRHSFFVVIGFDQMIHSVCLVVTAAVFIQ